MYDGLSLMLLRAYNAYDQSFAGGVNVATADVNGDGVSDVITAPQTNGGPEVRIFDGVDALGLDDFFAYDPMYRGGVTVG